MNPQHQAILDFIESKLQLSKEEKEEAVKLVKEADKVLTISEFKLERTEKVKRTTAILLEETIDELEQKRRSIEEANQALNNSIKELKATQAQLIQSEKMASLGELTAGIAHEIKNPLNFVNNFSEVSKELLEEMKEELEKGNYDLVAEIAGDVNQNLEKILHHGKRADGIVKGMLQHSRSNSGQKEEITVNNFVDEYLRLAYHGLRAKDKSFNAKMETDFDPNAGKIMAIPQELGRVVLNLVTNAFYAVDEKKKEDGGGFEPTVHIKTCREKEVIKIQVIDNGKGIPKENREKIFQPFFTTKPTGLGTGLGLSISYDIIKAHGGVLNVSTKAGVGTTFTIELPI
ncbi:two-component sensor histidine kinase [Christiangramia fulva]|uniref:histidine kinase n=1 Tax=Christiangramia fulva TaxID=2126553 RepID=A0A2R3Z541_9FLAO|nr:ATP-binding protein [Christiangramia fulva]AVR45397.1 two-component sensor histidine kinase [Christiangramia fulva]